MTMHIRDWPCTAPPMGYAARASVWSYLSGLWRAHLDRQARRAMRHALRAFDDRTLEDIGVSRMDLANLLRPLDEQRICLTTTHRKHGG